MGRRGGEHADPLLAASVGGRAAWPPVRHLADKELIRLRQGVRQKRCEHQPIAPTNLEILHFFDFFRKAGKENYAEFSSDFYIQTRFFSRVSGRCLADAKRKHGTASRTGF
ncbi:MAG: hypothetical protein ABIA63_01645, partial [bacterium]